MYDTKEKIRSFYDSNRYWMILSDWWHNTHMTKAFITFISLIGHQFKSFYPSNDTTEFDKNLMIGCEKFNEDREANYGDFFLAEHNKTYLEQADKIKRQPIQTAFNPEIFTRLQENIKSKININIRNPFTSKRTTLKSTISESIRICEETCLVTIQEKWSLFNIIGIKLFKITDYEGHYGTGYFYLRMFKTYIPPITIALDNHISYIKSSYTHDLTHEIIHAIQNSFTHFLDIPREISEVASIMIEHKVNPFDDAFITKLAVLSYADIIAENSKQYDTIINELVHDNKPYNVSHRIWQYVHYPRQYYAYILGIIIPYDQKHMYELARNPKKAYDILTEN